ncbi:MAG: DUF4416 domain-containing protein [Candidatus Latescibacterota bacterium]|nr:MAG: DUF4416 domain-containing protein [Candidatus Latescibacterota bacterium]
MGKPKLPEPVVLVVAVTAQNREILNRAKGELEGLFGPVAMESPVFPFDFTRYYEDEMGPELIKQFAAFKRPFRPDDLASIKLLTNSLEDHMALNKDGRRFRRANIDPGYLALSKLVLATTKDYAHRIYIGKGIYAEVTLIFRKGMWQPLEWTYPDYRTDLALDFFGKVRKHLLRLRTTPCTPWVSYR